VERSRAKGESTELETVRVGMGKYDCLGGAEPGPIDADNDW
jgi:hypothetical protein